MSTCGNAPDPSLYSPLLYQNYYHAWEQCVANQSTPTTHAPVAADNDYVSGYVPPTAWEIWWNHNGQAVLIAGLALLVIIISLVVYFVGKKVTNATEK